MQPVGVESGDPVTPLFTLLATGYYQFGGVRIILYKVLEVDIVIRHQVAHQVAQLTPLSSIFPLHMIHGLLLSSPNL